ncbi:urease subunit beta [Mammaliicoccus sciuri]|uniref:Urease subunit beta n=1 Tax=Sporosarcina newyorkensis TaxID=759851 RepID=A0A1T4YPG5_9BACL|nr:MULTISPECIES: urease subunit beta [Sporosarcina]MBY0221436.1 urease subunit beta [Sporosarcina aquimarina]SKB03626.1 urease subunit beta [Sporosarcina newyorkensis]
MIPGEYILKDEPINCNEGAESTRVHVVNEGDRPIQVGSHYHFYEVNGALRFRREETYGKRLNIPAGAAVRFEPGDEKEVQLIDYAGKREVYGFHNEVDGPLEGGNVK